MYMQAMNHTEVWTIVFGIDKGLLARSPSFKTQQIYCEWHINTCTYGNSIRQVHVLQTYLHRVRKKRSHVIFNYNSRIHYSILIIFLPLETGMNTLPNLYKLFYFNLTMSPLYVVILKMTQKQPTAYAVHSVELLFQTSGESRSMFVFFRFRQNISLAVFQQ